MNATHKVIARMPRNTTTNNGLYPLGANTKNTKLMNSRENRTNIDLFPPLKVQSPLQESHDLSQTPELISQPATRKNDAANRRPIYVHFLGNGADTVCVKKNTQRTTSTIKITPIGHDTANMTYTALTRTSPPKSHTT
jgi:hypothetical protein